MPKMKTKKTAQARVKITKSGKIMRKNVRTGHLKRKWSASKKTRKSGLTQQSNKGHIAIFKKLLPKSNIK